MANFGIRYAALVGSVMMGFVNFVACGSQFYQVSLQDDAKGRTQLSSVEGSDDPASPNFGLHSPGGWERLPIHFSTDYTLNDEQRRGLQAAMNVWQMATGQSLFVYDGAHLGVTGDSFDDLYSSLDDGINGHYLDEDWGKTGKPAVVLATTIWDNDPSDGKITTADIRFNANYYTIGDSLTGRSVGNKEIVDIQTLAIHELGHLLGLTHVSSSIDSQSIMTPSLYIGEGLANRRISRGDIQRIQKIYGCKAQICDPDQILAMINQSTGTKIKQPKSSSVDTSH
jgi:hypothetical protein